LSSSDADGLRRGGPGDQRGKVLARDPALRRRRAAVDAARDEAGFLEPGLLLVLLALAMLALILDALAFALALTAFTAGVG
jgi:hypothetical protein